MVDKIKSVSKQTKRSVETAYEVLAMSAAVAAAVKVASLPHVNDLPLWQVTAGVVLASVVAKVFTLLNKEA